MDVIKTAVKYRRITLFILIMLLCLGMFSYYFLPRQEYPEITAPVAMVTMIYPGASPEDIEKTVTSKIESEMKALDGYDYSFSYSYNSMAIAFVRLTYGTDTDKAWKNLQERLDNLSKDLPEQVGPAVIDTDLVETAGIMIAMSGEQYTSEELKTYAEKLKEQLVKVDGISKFELDGLQKKEVKIEVDYRKLNQLSLSLNDVVNLLKAQNIEIPAGEISTNDIRINVGTETVLASVSQIGEQVVSISQENGSVLRLKDIAKIEIAPVENQFKILQNGKEAVMLSGYFQKEKNVVLIGKEVRKVIDNFKSQLPDDIQFSEVLYQPDTVAASVNDFNVNLLEGMFFVIVVVLVGMGLRNALIVSTAIPSSIILTFIAMDFFNINIHQISVASLIVALGMLVDNAIVVIDSIQVKLDQGVDRLEACISGTKEIAIPVFTSTLTTTAAFMPLLLLPSIAGEYIVSLPSIIIISLSFSYLVAIFVTPCMAYLLLKANDNAEKQRIYKLRNTFQEMLKRSIEKRRVFMLLLIVLAVIAAAMGTHTGLKFFPYADSNMLYIDMHSEKNNDFDATQNIVANVEKLLREEPIVTETTTAIGGGLPKFYNTLPITAPSNQEAQMMLKVDLKQVGRGKTYQDLGAFTAAFQKKLDAQLIGGTAYIKQLEQGEPIGAPIRIRVSGKNMNEVGENALKLKQILSKIPGTLNVSTDYEYMGYEYRVKMDPIKSSYSGISSYDLQNEVSIALRGRSAGDIKLLDEDYPMVVQTNVSSTDHLEELGIKSSVTGHKTVLRGIADINLAADNNVIKKYDGDKTVQVFSDVMPGYSSIAIKRALIEEVNQNPLVDVKIQFDGEEEKIKENFGNIGMSGIYAVFFVYLILLIQFKSFTQPLIILLTIPLSTIGSFVGLFITRQELSFLSMLGIVSLLGIVVNNAIILMDFINVERREGKDAYTASLDAVSKRFRPIMLTTVTTVIGLVPLIMSGSKLFTPMSIALMSGLIVSTMLTLIVIPNVYEWTHRK